jgi:hypothetical protein
MKKLFLNLTTGLFFTLPLSSVYALNPADAQSCIMVYEREVAHRPNLLIACDGEQILSHQVRAERQLKDPATFRAELYKAFLVMTDPQGEKDCQQFETAHLWWGQCLAQPAGN